MTYFTPLEGTVLLHSRGLYTEAKLFAHNDEIFARRGTGFVRLNASGQTSRDKVFWIELRLDQPHTQRTGRLVLGSPEDQRVFNIPAAKRISSSRRKAA